ncbi:MAG: hypothetical protein LC795_06355 [Acidobacteria bacterium]|nr:hypothetical protein [Acidobacteriota bacterium]
MITLNAEHSYYRDQRSSTPRDTGDNAADFMLIGTNGGVPGIQTIPHLGAPGPENLNSPPQRNSGFTTGLLDPAVGASQPPNRSRDFTSDPANNSDFGTLLIRRTLTNNTGLPVSRLRFRVIIITTLGSPASECGGALCADLRARDSVDGQVSGVKMSEARTPGGAAAPSGPAAAPRIVYVPLFIDTRPRAPKSTRAAEDKAGEADENKEREPKEAQPSAQPAPGVSVPDSPAAAAKARRRGGQ